MNHERITYQLNRRTTNFLLFVLNERTNRENVHFYFYDTIQFYLYAPATI